METQESVRLSLQKGEWLTTTLGSVTLASTYLQTQGQGNTQDFIIKGKPNSNSSLFPDLSTAPMEFTIIVKEMKLPDQTTVIKIHQYLIYLLIIASTRDL